MVIVNEHIQLNITINLFVSIISLLIFYFHKINVLIILNKFWQSLRARTEKALVKSQLEDNDSKVAVKQILSFTLTEKVSLSLSLPPRCLILMYFKSLIGCIGRVPLWGKYSFKKLLRQVFWFCSCQVYG